MPGKLAELFLGGSTPQDATAESKQAQPASVSSPASLPEIHEQLRALKDPDVALQGNKGFTACGTCIVVRGCQQSRHAAGLRSLRLRLQASDAQDVRICFATQIDGLDALGSVWDTQSLVTAPAFCQSLYLLNLL